MTRARNSANLASQGNLFVDIANDRTGIGSVVPAQNLHVAGTAGFHADTTFVGDLYNATWDRSDNSLKFVDNAQIRMGNNNDLSFSHDGSASRIQDSYGALFIGGNLIELKTANLGEIYLNCTANGAVSLRHNNVTKFETTAYGTNTTGTAVNDGLVVAGVATVTTMNVTGVLTYDDVTSVDSVGIVTARQGVRVTADGSSSSNYISVGAGSDLRIFHSGSANEILSMNGALYVKGDASNVVGIQPRNGENAALFYPDGAVELYHNNLKKFETTSAGVSVTGTVVASGAATLGNGSGLNWGDTSARIRGESGSSGLLRFDTNGGERLRIDSSGDMGLGTSTIENFGGGHVTLEVAGTTTSQGGVFKTATSDSAGTGSSGTEMIMFTDNTQGAINVVSSDPLTFSTANTERLRITSGGNLGVAGATGTDFSLLDGMVINAGNGKAGLIINSSSSSHNAYMSFGYGSGSSTSHADQYSAYIGRVGDNTLILGTNNNIRVLIDSSGLVAMGGNTNLLDSVLSITNSVGDCIRLRSNTTNNTFKYGVIKLDSYANSSNGVQIIGGKSDSSYNEVAIGGGVDTGYAATQIHFVTAANTTTQPGTVRLKIDSSGNMSVGGNFTANRHVHIKDTGQIKLESTATGAWTGLEFLGSSGTNNYDGYMGVQDSNGLFFIDNNSNGIDFCINRNGKVFIGADSTDFSDAGTFLNLRNNTYGGRIGFSNNTATAGATLMEQFSYWGTNKVAGFLALAGTDTSNKDDGLLGFYTRESGNAITQRLRIGSNGGTIISNAGSFPASTNETLTIQGEGHNGHGTTNTRSVFNITAAMTSRPGNGGGGLWVGARTNEDTAVVGTRTAAGDLAIETYNSGWGERLRITSDGFVGIGEDNPKTGLTIAKLGDYSTDDGNTYYMPVGKWSSAWNKINVIDNSTDYWVGFVGGYTKTSSTVNIALAPNRGNTSQQAGMYISGEATGAASADFTVGKIMGGSATGQGTSGNVRATKSELFRIASNGNVSIQTNNVGFSGAGTLRINSGSTAGALNLDGGATNHGGEINLTGGSNGGRIQFRTGQGSGQQDERMRLDESGRLLIGATNTNNAFSGGDDLIIGNTDSGTRSGITLVSNSSQDGGLYFSDGTSSNSANVMGQLVYDHTNNFMRFYTSAVEKMRIHNTGKITIGNGARNAETTTGLLLLDADLTAEGDVSDKNNYHLVIRSQTNSNTSKIGIAFANTTDDTHVGAAILHHRESTDSQGTLSFYTSPTTGSTLERFRINAAGGVKFYNYPGTGNVIEGGGSTVYANAAINLWRQGNGYCDMRLTSNYGVKIALAGASNNTDEVVIQQDNSKNAYIKNEASQPIYFQTGSSNTTRVAIRHSGAQGIDIYGEAAYNDSNSGARGIDVSYSGSASVPIYFGTETGSAQKGMYMHGYWMYIRGHVNEGVRFVFSQASGAPHGNSYQFKYNSALRPGGSNTWDGFSDVRAKENVVSITNGIDTIKKLRPVTFDWTNDYADSQTMYIMGKDENGGSVAKKENGYDTNMKNGKYGFIAQEYETVFPRDIKQDKYEMGGKEIEDFKTLNHDSLIPTLTAALKEAVAKIEVLEAKVAALEGS